MCVARIARCVREMWPSPAPARCALMEDRERERERERALQPQSTWIREMGNARPKPQFFDFIQLYFEVEKYTSRSESGKTQNPKNETETLNGGGKKGTTHGHRKQARSNTQTCFSFTGMDIVRFSKIATIYFDNR
jgi:hypothetical protein